MPGACTFDQRKKFRMDAQRHGFDISILNCLHFHNSIPGFMIARDDCAKIQAFGGRMENNASSSHGIVWTLLFSPLTTV